MKKNYEKSRLIFALSIFLMLIIALCFIVLFKMKIIVYKNISGIVFSDNIITFLVDEHDLKLFYKNKTIYFLGEKKRFMINRVDKNVLERNGVKYHYVYLNVEIPKNYKVNDVLKISVVEKKIQCIKIFKVIWDVWFIKKIEQSDLEKINVGVGPWIAVGLGISALIVFLAGVFEGYTHPGRCGWE